MFRRSRSPSVMLAIALLCGDGACSHGGYVDGTDLGGQRMDAASAALCGNGLVDPGEACDTAIAAGLPGSCPTACTPSPDPCIDVSLTGAACQVRCQSTPRGVDCPIAATTGMEQTVCSGGKYHVPTISAGSGHYAVGCMPNGTQQEAPKVVVLDAGGHPLQTQLLLTADGDYYTDIQTTAFDGRFQVLYQYNCTDMGTWGSGWGWGCIDFREFDPMGMQVTPSTVFGQTGHNGHPVLDYSGNSFGVAWVSYDSAYFCGIDANRHFVGGGKLNNTLIGQDPKKSDDRDGARTKIAWNGSGWGVFNIIGSNLYFSYVDASGRVQYALKPLGPGYSQIFSGQFSVAAAGGIFYVAYFDLTAVQLLRVKADGTTLGSTKIQDGSYLYPNMIERDGRFFLFTQDASAATIVTQVDTSGAIVRTAKLDGGPAVQYPVAATDAGTGAAAMVYLDGAGNVKFRQLLLSP